MHATDTIPQPAPWPLFGNIFDVNPHAPVQSLIKLARQRGPIFRLALQDEVVVLSSQELVNEVCDQERFDKYIHAPLAQLRQLANGLFTASTSDPNWRKAHNILLPNFGGAALRGYLPQMIDLAEQLVLKWQRLNPEDVVSVTDDMTRLTLDTIGLCGFNYRFNSFYRDSAHPFVEAMIRALGDSLLRAIRLPLIDALMWRTRRQFARDVAFMNRVVDQVISRRRADPAAMADKHDLLGYMLTGIDKQTGSGLDDVNIRHQIITFLIAGHETTSGLLSFALYFLLKNPAVLQRARNEADRVLADYPGANPTQARIQRLVYVHQVLKEALRLWPTAPAFALSAKEDTHLAGRYPIRKEEPLLVLLPMLHRDPAVWGADAEAFNPDHFSPEREAALPPNAFKPFGNGQRACIGQQFALQEAALVLGMVLRRFDFIDHAGYQLRIKETLTIKPDGFTIQVRPRRIESAPAAPERSETAPSSGRGALPVALTAPLVADAPAPTPNGAGAPVLVLYGSNLGTAEGVAQRIAEDGRARGFAATVAPLDDATGDLPREGAVVVVTASYNGTPPDNARRFCAWLEGSPTPGELAGVRYAVFGCGDHNWATTYQAVPRRVDEGLAARGAMRLLDRGEGDAADDFDGQFRAWYAPLWGRIGTALGRAMTTDLPKAVPAYRIEPVSGEPAVAPGRTGFGAVALRVLSNRELQQGSSTRSTRHLELELPAGTTYQTGDHVGVLPRNGAKLVQRVLGRFGLEGSALVRLSRDGSAKSHLPLNAPVRLADLLSAWVEIQDTATREQLQTLVDRTNCPPEKARLVARSEKYREEVFDRHVSVLDLLEATPACELSFAEYLGMLPPLRPRYYSISSSPRVAAGVASITIGVLRESARSGRGVYEGVASSYLAEQPEGGEIFGFIRNPGTPFRPPEDARTPMIMVGAGTGLAPFRGFLQDRAALQQQGREVGPSLLFFGCRTPEQDFLYASELHDFEARGVTRVIPAFSRVPGQPKCYVQDAVQANAEVVWSLLERGAIVYVCGDAARMAPAVRAAFAEVSRKKTGGEGEAWLAAIRGVGRYLEDVWASS